MNILWLTMTDGRDDLLDQTLQSFHENLFGPIARKVIHTDNGHRHRTELSERYPDFEVIGGSRRGFGGAYSRAWSYISTLSDITHVMSTEDDFLLNRVVNLHEMAWVLDTFPDVHQLCLLRQPWNEQEIAAGSIINVWPDEYTDVSADNGKFHASWLEHRLFWSTNPSLHRASICKRGWPNVEHSERRFSEWLFESDPNAVCAYWGSRASGEWCYHIGEQRVGRQY